MFHRVGNKYADRCELISVTTCRKTPVSANFTAAREKSERIELFIINLVVKGKGDALPALLLTDLYINT